MADSVKVSVQGKGEVAPNRVSSVKEFMAMPKTIKRVEDLLGKRSSQFMTSVSSMVGADDKLAACEPVSLFMACLTAAALDLPVSKSLGHAHIIPYENKRAGVTEAQFQLGWKGWVQLAQRSGQYKTIAATEVYEGQLVTEDPLEGNKYDWSKRTGDKVVGYVCRFTLINGFSHELYMSQADMEKHAKQYSKAYSYDLAKGYKSSPWSSNFSAMALKTVIKLNISKFGPMSIEMQKAAEVDQAVIRDDGSTGKAEYIDGEVVGDEVKATDNKKAAILAANSSKTTEEKVAEVMSDDNDSPRKSGK